MKMQSQLSYNHDNGGLYTDVRKLLYDHSHGGSKTHVYSYKHNYHVSTLMTTSMHMYVQVSYDHRHDGLYADANTTNM